MSELEQKSRFVFKICQPDFEQVLKSISTIVEDATFNVSPDGITFRAMDPSHVALIDVSLPNAMFEKYEAEGESKFGVRVDEIVKLVKQFDKRSRINVTVNSDNLLILSNAEYTYKMRLIESSANDCPLPKIPYDAKSMLMGKTLQKYFQKVEVVSDYITLKNDGINFYMSGKGDAGELNIHLEKGHEDLMEISARDDLSEAAYSLEYLIPYLKSFSANVPQSVQYSTQRPLRVDSKIANIGRLHFYLAPRVEN